MKELYRCSVCHKTLDSSEAYEYRGAYSCEDHFDAVIEARDFQRKELMLAEESKLIPLSGLDLHIDNPIGRANRDLMKRHIEIASKESLQMKIYEGRYEE